MTLLVDSSVWIDFFNGALSPETEFLYQGLGVKPFIVGDLILTEILQGFRLQQDYEAALAALTKLPVVSMVGRHIAIRSARNYRTLRAKGITIRKTIDTFIATFCIENEYTLLHRDRDFDQFEQHLGLDVYHPK